MPRTRRVLGLAFRSVLTALVPACFAGGLLVEERAAQAEDKIEYADGPAACRAFHAKNEAELAAWSKTQPAVPYAYPREDTILGAPWGPLTSGLG